MPIKQELKEGARISWDRTVTEEDIRRFGEVSGDKGVHHLEKDADGRLLAHGLLVATLPTKLGGDLDYVARTMHFDFIKPVYSGDSLHCAGRVESVLAKKGRKKVRFSFAVTNQKGVLVMKGNSSTGARTPGAGRSICTSS